VANTAVVRDYLALIIDVLTIMTTEAARGIKVSDIVFVIT
jgi:hypothetical protein